MDQHSVSKVKQDRQAKNSDKTSQLDGPNVYPTTHIHTLACQKRPEIVTKR